MESQSDSTQTVSSLKLLMLKTRDYDLWIMRMEQYLTHTDYALWEVIVNGDAPAIASASTEGSIPPKTAEQKIARKNELKAKSTLLLAIPDEHLLKFHEIKDAKSLWEAIKTRFRGNKESKKMQKTILKQQYENFTASRFEGLDKIYDRNKPDLDGLSMDDLYNNLKVYEAEIKSQSSLNSNSQNVAFVSSKNTSSTNEAVNTDLDVSTASTQGQASSSTYADGVMFSFFVNQSKSPLLDNKDMEHIDSDDLEEMDLKWQVAMLTIRIKRFIKKTRRNLNLNSKEVVGLDMTKVECYNYHMKVESSANALVVQDGIGGYDWSFQTKEGPIDFALMAHLSSGSSSSSSLESELEEAFKEKDDLKLKLEKFEESSKNLTKLINSQISVKDKTGLGFDSHVNESEVLDNVVDSHECNQVNDRFKKSEGYHAVPPPFTGNFKPARADLSFAGLDDSVYKSKVSETITSVPNVETTVTKTSKDSLEKPKTVRFSAPIIEDWESDSEDENVFEPKEVKKTVKSNFEKIEFVNARNSTVEKPRKLSQNPRDNKRNGNSFKFTKKACFVCGSFNHLIKDCDFHDKKMVQKHVLNNVKKGTTVLTKSGIVPISDARQSSSRAAAPASAAKPINTVTPKPFVNVARPRPNAFHKSHSPSRTPFNQQTTLKNRNLNDKVNTAKGNPQYALQDQGIFDSGCSRHMTGNKFYLSDYQDIDGGFVAFGGSSKGGKITGKGKIRTGKLDFEDTECLVLSPDFKLLDESQVLLKIPRQNNMYSFDLKNVVPLGDLTCLFAKATIDESNLWHRRLGHINFKTMNKLVRGNLVRGLPLKLFENDHTCVACQKGKQHKASVYVRSINRKSYCLVVTDDFSRFSWVFFLATKDETPEILKNFITGIENQSDHKVKTIRSNNGTEFKNRIMNEFCDMKAIRREFSVARTPQQNGVAERKNRTLIETARTILADSKLATTF
ncbi:putative ribonuclease H-like domain-containing protein [Tanacetum coccineum]